MGEPSTGAERQIAPASSGDAPQAVGGLWQRVKDHKLVQTALAYFAASLALAHGEELIANAYGWPELVGRVLIGLLALGLPLTLAIVWFSGRKLSPAARAAAGRTLDRLFVVILALLVVGFASERFLIRDGAEPGQMSQIFIVALGLLVVALLADRFLFSRRAREAVLAASVLPAATVAAQPAAVPDPADDRASIAVLPFTNMSADAEQEYFSDGLSEELLNQLAQMKGLRVAARTSCFAFKGQNPDLKEVSQKLSVAHVLEGSVRKAGNRLRVTAQLIKAADGYHLWSKTFDRELDDVFAIQEDIARAVAEALKVTLGMKESTLIAGGTKNVEAYDLYLRALALSRQGAAQSMQRAIALLREAVELDPRFAMAWASLAVSYVSAMILSPETTEASRKLSDEAFERAKACAPDAWKVHEVEATQLMLGRRDWIGAGQAFDKARELSQSAESGEHPYFLACVGRTEEAIRGYQRLVRTDPLLPMAMLQFTLDSAGRYEEAESEYKRTRSLPVDPALLEYWAFLRSLAREGSQSAKLQFKRYLALNDGYMPIHNEVLAKFDDKQAVLELLRKAFEDPFYQSTSRMDGLAQLAAYFGDEALALACLRRGFVEMRGVTVAALWHPNFVSLRKTEGFKDLVRDLGLYDYWRTTGKWGDFCHPLGTDDFECR